MPPSLTLSRLLTPQNIFLSLATTIFLNDKVFEICSVNGPSMAPTLSPTYHETGQRDYLLLSKWKPRGDVKRGDVVAFYTPFKPDLLGIKRVVGVEGDCVELDPRRRPDCSLIEGSDDVEGGMQGVCQRGGAGGGGEQKRMCMVPAGHVWVEGDNYRASSDSNKYGPISKNLIVGKAVCVLLPWGRFRERPWEGFESQTVVRRGLGLQQTDDVLEPPDL